MFVARNLRKTNIAEYLLYMWQVEDLLRSCRLDIDALTERVVSQYQLDDAQRAELIEWYENLIEMMRHDGVETEGHLQINKNVIIQLSDLHARLMHSTKFPYYQTAYYQALPAIVELRAKGAARHENELENCFDALYGVWMLKLQHRPLSTETAEAAQRISTLLGMLSDYYIKDNAGELKFE